ncbi:hypothetical protein V1264_016743 [Littorina saxatilis]|uniref:Uncharacterized protein n=1 Tax=Littorina saxatilis TaxID=31220 RepID=A0AAN9GFY4_9CAEN
MVDLANFYDVEAVNIHLIVAGGNGLNGEVRVYLEDPIDVLVRERGRPGTYVPVGSFLAYDTASLCFSYDNEREAKGLRRCNKVLRGRYVFMTQNQSDLELCEMEVMAKTLLPDRRFGLPPDPLNLTYHADSTSVGTGWNVTLQTVDTSVRKLFCSLRFFLY